MMSFLRKHRGWLMIVITILALPFCLYFVKTDYSKMHSDAVATIFGRTLTNTEFQRNGRLYFVAEGLGMDTLAQSLSAGSDDQKKAATYFALNLAILQHEAPRLGIEPTQAEMADFIRNLRGFRGPNGFDPKKYQEFSENVLPANGFSAAQIEELAGYALSLNRLKELVTIGVAIPDSESKTTYEQTHGKLFVHAIRIHGSDFLKDVKVTDDDIKKYYDSHQKELMTEEKRKVEFVSLNLTDDQKKLAGRERVEALQKLADRANDFTQALSEKNADFKEVTAKFQLPVKTTGEFTAAEPDPQLKVDPQLAAMAFQLTSQEPTSEPVQAQDGFYILRLAGIVPARPLTLEEAKNKIVDLIKANRTREMAMNKGRTAAQELREALRSGAPLKFALEKANVKAETITPFSVMEAFDPSDAEKKKERPKDFVAIKNAATQTQPGEVSEFFPWEDGGMIVYVEKREPPDEAKYREEKTAFDERFLKNKREVVFNEWLHDRQREAGLLSGNRESNGPPPRGAAPQRAPSPPPEQKS